MEDEKYTPSGYNIFLIREPKYRAILSQNITDKLINHVVANVLVDVLEPSLINNNIATRKDRGTHYGIKLLKRYLNELKGKEIYALKFDISKFFYSVDHDILKAMLQRKIKDKRFLNILFSIIDSTNNNVNDTISRLKEQEIDRIKRLNVPLKKIKELESIPLYEHGKGLPIGNMTSQIMAIFYLNDLDHFINEKLDVKYIRYMDDGILLSNDKNYLKYCLTKIEEIICQYKLKLNNKTIITNVTKNGVDFLGFRFYIYNNKVIMKVRNNTKKRFKKKMQLIKKGKICDNSSSIISSYKGHFKWGNCYNLLEYIPTDDK